MNDVELDSLLDEALGDFTPPAPPAGAAATEQPSAAPSAEPPVTPAFDPLGRMAASPGVKAKKKKAGSAGQAVDRGGGDPSHAGAAQRPFAAEDVQATLAALEAQTRVTTGASAGGSGSGPAAGGLPDALLQDLEGLDDESYQALLREFESMGGDPGLASALDSFLSNLLSKDVLYEPLQQISMRYPAFLASARERGLAEEELHRYTRQAALVAELLAVFDRSPQEAERIMQLMQDMQKCGAPPPEIMKDIAPELRLGEDGMPEMPTEADLTELQHAGGAELASMCAQQ